MMCTRSKWYHSDFHRHTYTISFLFAVLLLPPTTQNMGILEIMFLLSTTFPSVHASNQNVCPTSNCGSLYLRYPFKLQNTQAQDNCTYIDLNCNATLNTKGTAIVSLPFGGDFYVRYISYYAPHIRLYDPGSCLMRRLMKNLNLSSSPFKAVAYEKYTFYTCPANSGVEYYCSPIDCLSNSTNSTVATAFVSSEYMLDIGCQVIGSWLLPVLGKGQFDFDGTNGDLYLTWNSTSCIACEDHTGQPADTGGSKGIAWAIFAASPFFIPAFVTLAISLTICLLRIIKYIVGRNESNFESPAADGLPLSSTATAALPPRSTAGGLDESKINSCTELVVLSESRISPGPDSHTCSICLESYRPQELVRNIAKCGHCFHADCIELWLRKNRTCPVCRTIL